ncbi:MAG: cell division protein ZapA [Oscillospiraceae bacterium]|nr:cell division protein ZapA [Oscillospiraceae bacterium]
MTAVKQKIPVIIAGQDFSLISTETEAHINRTATLVDDEIRSVQESSPALSKQAASILAAVNLADRVIRAEETAESLRKQLKDYIEEVAKAKNDLADTRRELNKLKKEK